MIFPSFRIRSDLGIHNCHCMAQQRRANLLPNGGLWYSEQGYTETCCVMVQREYKERLYFWNIQCIVNIKKFLRRGCSSGLVHLAQENWNKCFQLERMSLNAHDVSICINNKVSLLAKCQSEMFSHNFIYIPQKEVQCLFSFCQNCIYLFCIFFFASTV